MTSRKTYPRISAWTSYRLGQLRQRDKSCIACDQPAVAFICVEYSPMRGEDELYDVCGACWRESARNEDLVLGKIFEDMG